MFGWQFQGTYIARYICIIIQHSRWLWPSQKLCTDSITKRRYESRLVKSRNEIKFSSVWFIFNYWTFLWFTSTAFCFGFVFELCGEWWRFNEFHSHFKWMNRCRDSSFFHIFVLGHLWDLQIIFSYWTDMVNFYLNYVHNYS